MNPWTKAELEKAWVMVHFTHADSCKERYSFRAERVKTFPKGSTMRDQVHASAWNIHLWKLVICTPNGMRWSTTPNHLVNAILDSEEVIRIDDTSPSYWLCLVRRSESLGSPFTVELISPSVRRLLLTQLWKWKVKDHIDMVVRFARIPGGAGWSGVMFESLQQHLFSNKICVVAEQMFRTGSARSCWQPAFGDFSASPLLRKAREAVQPITITLDIRPWRCEYISMVNGLQYKKISTMSRSLRTRSQSIPSSSMLEISTSFSLRVVQNAVWTLVLWTGLPSSPVSRLQKSVLDICYSQLSSWIQVSALLWWLLRKPYNICRTDWPLKFDSDFSTVDEIISQAALPVTHLL